MRKVGIHRPQWWTRWIVSIVGAVGFTVLTACGSPFGESSATVGRQDLATKLDELEIPDEFVLVKEEYTETSGEFVVGSGGTLIRDYGLQGIDPERAVGKFVEVNENLDQVGFSDGIRSFQDGDYRIALLYASGSTDPGEQLPEGVMVRITIQVQPS